MATQKLSSIQDLLSGRQCKEIWSNLYTFKKALLVISLHSIGPLPDSANMSVTSQFSPTELNTKNPQFITYTNGYYPVVNAYAYLLAIYL